MEKCVLASNNEHKLKEFREILNDREILSLKDINFYEDIEENGSTFEENCLIKARTIAKYLKEKGLNYVVLADDTGLCVDALNGEPGIFSARYAGSHGNNQANRDLVLKNLQGKEDRSAHFKCVIVEVKPDGKELIVEGRTNGRILEEERGDKSFGYDCIFYSDDLGKAFGEASAEEKNSVSHRGRALESLLKKEQI